MIRLEHSVAPSRRSAALYALLACLLLLLGGCAGDVAEISPEDRQAIRTLLESYLPLMAESYGSGRFEKLEGFAVEKEIASVRKRVNDLALGGRDLRPELVSVEVEDITVWNHSNAFVTTLEIWNLHIYATGTETVLSEELGQRNRVKYQIKRREEGWQVLYRTLDTTFDG
ncbi:MAG: hypothetical protein AAGK22_17440 [Acidobacteriota bacterium]